LKILAKIRILQPSRRCQSPPNIAYESALMPQIRKHLLLLAFSMLATVGWSVDGFAQEAKSDANEKQVESEDPKKDSAHFMRIRKDAKGRPVALETSVTRYELLNDKGERITVDLIGAVHIGEASYFEALNKRFEQYESLLYELVAPEGTVIPKGGGRGEGIPTNPIAAMQVGMQSVLGLEFQLEHIDYTKKNFKHADMSPEEFAESMSSNDESIAKYGLRAIGQSMAIGRQGWRYFRNGVRHVLEKQRASYAAIVCKTDPANGSRHGGLPGPRWLNDHRPPKRKVHGSVRGGNRSRKTQPCDFLRGRALARHAKTTDE
jgi:hypothetical protein